MEAGADGRRFRSQAFDRQGVHALPTLDLCPRPDFVAEVGMRLFGRLGAAPVDLETTSVERSGQLTNLRFHVLK